MKKLLYSRDDKIKIDNAEYDFTFTPTNKKAVEKSFVQYHWRCERTGQSIRDYNTIKESLGRFDLYYSAVAGNLKTVNLWSRVTGTFQLMARPNSDTES